MLEHRNFSVDIKCGGTVLEHFATKVEDEKTISCYIASEVGKAFSIELRNNLRRNVVADCYVDGLFTEGSFIRPQSMAKCSGFRADDDYIWPYKFVPLVVTDDETVANPRDSSTRDVGAIQVKVYRAEKGAKMARSKAAERPKESAVHERSKKAGTHRVSFSKPVISKTTKSAVIWHDDESTPYITFKLQYRPRDLLLAQGIIGNSGSPQQGRSQSSNGSANLGDDTDSDIMVIEAPQDTGPSRRKRRREVSSQDIIDVDALESDNAEGIDVTAIEAQLANLTRQLERVKRRKLGNTENMHVKKEKVEEADIDLS